MALSNQKKEQVADLLKEGYTMDEIAKALSINEKTVRRIKKALTTADSGLEQLLTENKYNRKFQKSQEKYLCKIKAEEALFEDLEEGWTYHMTAQEMREKEGGRWWSFIVYPESAPKDWKELVSNLHCEWSHSPLHDKDLWTHDKIDEETGVIYYKSGQRKKAHWHCIIKFDKSMSYMAVNELIRPMTNGPYLQKCYSLKGAFEYFVHLNNPEKYQYEKDEICRFNGFAIETTRTDRIKMLDEIGSVISAKGYIDLENVRKHYEGQYEYIDIISTRAFYIEKLTQVNFHKSFPEGRTQKVKIVKDEVKL